LRNNDTLGFHSLSLRLLMVFTIALLMAACTQEHADEKKAPPPAKVENAVKEGDLATITLSPEAESRLGIETAAVELISVSQTRTIGGEIVLPPDSTITVSAPVAGTVIAPQSGGVVSAGEMVRKGEEVFRLIPILAPERNLRPQAEKEVTDAQIRLDAAKTRLERAEQLLRDKAGSQKAVDQAKEEMALAESALKTAKEKLDRINASPLEGDTPVAVVAPQDAMVRKVNVGVGQKVAATTPLFEIASLNSIWVRVPVYAGDANFIDRKRAAQVRDLGASEADPAVTATPVAAPPSANSNAATVDLYFELSRPGKFRPGERVSVTLALVGAEENLVVPYSAIVHDVHGGEWVYENIAPQKYTRRRVEVKYVAGDRSVLARGPAAGAKVVTVGVAELFGTEFGAGK
jgi:RND family efflux transporter MFP subunit